MRNDFAQATSAINWAAERKLCLAKADINVSCVMCMQGELDAHSIELAAQMIELLGEGLTALVAQPPMQPMQPMRQFVMEEASKAVLGLWVGPLASQRHTLMSLLPATEIYLAVQSSRWVQGSRELPVAKVTFIAPNVMSVSGGWRGRALNS